MFIFYRSLLNFINCEYGFPVDLQQQQTCQELSMSFDETIDLVDHFEVFEFRFPGVLLLFHSWDCLDEM